MRLLHTSDWHLGQTLHNFDRSAEHQHFLDWLTETLAAQKVDALLVSGDIFDNANPSSAAQALFYRFLSQAKARCPALDVIIIAGNHDSPGRLEAPADLLHSLGCTVIGQVHRDASGEPDIARLRVPLHNASGKVAAWCLAIPFLRPGDVPRVENAENPYAAGVAQLYRQAEAQALTLRQSGQAIIATGHCHMRDGQISETSERHLVVGGNEALPTSLFGPQIAYAALGHLHLAQRVGGQEHVRYPGSPLPLSFAEIHYPHQVLLVEFAGEQLARVEALQVPRRVELRVIPEQAAPLAEVLAQLAALELPDLPVDLQPLLEVRVLLTQPEPGLRRDIEAALEGKPVRLARIATRHAASGDSAAPPLSLDDLSLLRPEDIFRKLYQQRFGEEVPAELFDAFTELQSTAVTS